MRCVANFEVSSECSVITDDLKLNIEHPRGLYSARIKNIQRQDYSTPFLLSLHIYFDSPSLEEAREVAEELLADCLNMLVFTTGASFRLHRIRQIVDVEPQEKSAMRSVLMWSDKVDHDDPQPILNEENATTIEQLLEFDIPPAIRRALRWYRIGVGSKTAEDQFIYFWFALEILAEHQKSSAKTHDKCPHCQSPLYCEVCETHPMHKPYAKQAINDLLKAADKEFDEETFKLLDGTRNGLMHGATLREIEATLPEPRESVVDTLGRLLWRALLILSASPKIGQ